MEKVKKHRTKKPTKCPCLTGWVCEVHPNQPWNHRGCGAAGELCKNPQCDKDPDFLFLSVGCRVRPNSTGSKAILDQLPQCVFNRGTNGTAWAVGSILERTLQDYPRQQYSLRLR